jgi:glycosyltransferase involved in cell wall biosynthesis
VSGTRVFGVLLVRDEVDVVRLNVLHHLSFGCERILALDNGSSDGTETVLRRLADRVPLSWTSDPGPYRQAELFTGLAQEATARGADWIVPLDADEFWIAPNGLPPVLERQGPGAWEVERVEFIQRVGQARPSPEGLLTMTRRIAEPLDPFDTMDQFEAGRRSMFELEQGPKLLLRASAELEIGRGAHKAAHLAGEIHPTGELEILHAPLRARACLDRKAEHGERLERVGAPGLEGWQVRHWAKRARSGTLDEGWAAHAYAADGTLHVGDRRVPLLHDERLARALGRWVRSRPRQLLARALRRTY